VGALGQRSIEVEMAEFLNIIKKRKGKYYLISHKGKTLGVHTTREDAERQERAIEVSKHKHGAEIIEQAKELVARTAKCLGLIKS